MDRCEDERASSGRIVVGAIIVLVGVAMLVERAGVAEVHLSSRLWPFILIVLGLVRLAERPRPGRRGPRRSGAWLLWVGAWGFVSEFHVLGLDYESSWPLLIIGAGLGMVWGALSRSSVPAESQPLERN